MSLSSLFVSQGGRNGSLVFVEFEPNIDVDDVSQSHHPAMAARHSDRVDHSPFSFSSSSSSSLSSVSSSLRSSPFRLSASGVNRGRDHHNHHNTFGGIGEVDIVDDQSSETYDNAAVGDSALAAFGSRHRNDRDDDDDDADVDDGGGNRYDGGTNDISGGGSRSGSGGGLFGWLRWLIGAKDATTNGANGTDSSGMENVKMWRDTSAGMCVCIDRYR